MYVWFTSDLHLGHKNICNYRSKFDTVEEHDEFMFSKIESLSKRDILYIIGDFLFDGPRYDEYVERLSKVRCELRLIMGNHDSRKLYSEDCVKMQLPLFTYKGMWVSHCPIHPEELRFRRLNIHGHMHGKVLPDSRYFNVNIDCNGYEFVPFETIKARAESLERKEK